MGCVRMRKLVTIMIVCAMTLTLFIGLFGGVVEEVEGTATYDAGSNTILVTNSPNTLPTIDILISDDIFFYNATDDSYKVGYIAVRFIGIDVEFLYSRLTAL